MTRKNARKSIKLILAGAAILATTPLAPSILLYYISPDCPSFGGGPECSFAAEYKRSFYAQIFLATWLLAGGTILVAGILRYYSKVKS